MVKARIFTVGIPLLMTDYLSIINKYYESGSPLWQILIRHSLQVSDKALQIASSCSLDLLPSDIVAAGMLHDIGIFLTDAPGIECHGEQPYIRHGILGADLLRSEGWPEWLARIAERHTGSGLTAEYIAAHDLPLPHSDFVPETLLEKLICYSDKFFSKSGDMREKSLERVRESMRRHGPDALNRFDQLHTLFNKD